MSLAGALDDVTVVAFEQAVAAPLATRHLGDLGARVIKVERPEGDFARGYDRSVLGQASYFVWLNRGKESIALDLKDSGDLETARRLALRADVVVQNLAPGAMARLGLDLEELRTASPRLITCSISGYGPSGPHRDRKAYDLLLQAESGLLDVTGGPDQRAKVGISVVDIATGVYAFSGILAALLERSRTGSGQHLEVAMIDAIGEWMCQPYYVAAYGTAPPARTGSRHASIAPYGPFRTGDGKQIFVAVQNDREWAALCTQVLGRPDLVDDERFAHNPERVQHVAEVTEIVEAGLADHDVASARVVLDGAGIANSEMGGVAALGAHPQLEARDRWRTTSTPGGDVRALVPPLLPDGHTELGDVPAVGQHTEQIRRFLDIV